MAYHHHAAPRAAATLTPAQVQADILRLRDKIDDMSTQLWQSRQPREAMSDPFGGSAHHGAGGPEGAQLNPGSATVMHIALQHAQQQGYQQGLAAAAASAREPMECEKCRVRRDQNKMIARRKREKQKRKRERADRRARGEVVDTSDDEVKTRTRASKRGRGARDGDDEDEDHVPHEDYEDDEDDEPAPPPLTGKALAHLDAVASAAFDLSDDDATRHAPPSSYLPQGGKGLLSFGDPNFKQGLALIAAANEVEAQVPQEGK